MTYDPTPRLSPTTSIESTDSLVTPNRSDTFTFVDDCAVGEGAPDGHFLLFENSSEVWEEFKGAGCDVFGVPVTDAGIPMSPSSSLLSGIDLLGDTSPPPLPEVIASPILPGSRQAAPPRRASLFDFPPPPILVPDPRRILREPRPISGNPLKSIRHSKSNASQRWNTLPSAAFHPDKPRGSNEPVTRDVVRSGTFRTLAARGAVTCIDPPVALSSGPGPACNAHGVGFPLRRPRRREAPDTFTSFIDMSVNESPLSKSRVHKLFSKISSSLTPRKKLY